MTGFSLNEQPGKNWNANAGGADRMSYFKNVVAKPKIYNTGAAFDFSGFGSGSLWIALVTFLYVDFLDTTGTLFSMCNFVNIFIPGSVYLLYVVYCACLVMAKCAHTLRHAELS